MAGSVVSQVLPTAGLFSGGLGFVVAVGGGVIAVRFAFAAFVLVKRGVAAVSRDSSEDDLYEETLEAARYMDGAFMDDWTGDPISDELADELVAAAVEEAVGEEAMSVALDMEMEAMEGGSETAFTPADYYDEIAPGVYNLTGEAAFADGSEDYNRGFGGPELSLGGDEEGGGDLMADLDHAAYFSDLDLDETTDEELEEAGDAQAA